MTKKSNYFGIPNIFCVISLLANALNSIMKY